MPVKKKAAGPPAAQADEAMRICFDRVIPDDYQPVRSVSEHAVLESVGDAVEVDLPGGQKGFRAAIMAIKKWPADRRTLRCRFLDGDAKQRKMVEAKARIWELHANVKFEFVAAGDAEIRIAFTADAGSWSALGTDALVESYFPRYQPTMNFGWLTADTEEREYERVVLHEFGHALGLIHEHQSPRAKLRWREREVYRVFSGYPNYWSEEEIRRNVLERYSPENVDATRFDEDSIMLYMFPGSLFLDGRGTKMNYSLSRQDKDFIARHYPFG